MRVDIIFLDLDGTLLKDDKTVSHNDKSFLWNLYNVGITIGYVTSRAGRKIAQLIEGLPCDFIAENNGSVITYFSDEEPCEVFRKGFDGMNGVHLIDSLLKINKDISAVMHPFEFWNGEVSKEGEYVGSYEKLKSSIKNHEFQRIRVYNLKEYGIGAFDKIMTDEIIVRHEGLDCIFEPYGIDKGKAVREILSYYSISNKYAMAFGDSEWDVPMLNECFISVAMENASPEVKNAARMQTKSNNESGVSSFLIEHLGLHGNRVKSTFSEEQCVCLLNDVGKQNVVSLNAKRQLLANGYKGHEVLGYDYKVTDEEYGLFERLTQEKKYEISKYVGVLAEGILADVEGSPVIVSLARGGMMYGALCKYYLEHFCDIRVPHYTISLIRDVGLDLVALTDIIRRHGSERIRFVDGWTGSGLIASQLKEYVSEYNMKNGTALSKELSAVCDVPCVCRIRGTSRDILLPDSCLNATVCGLISSIYLTNDIFDVEEYHSATIWNELSEEDHTQWYYNQIISSMEKQSKNDKQIFGTKKIYVMYKVIYEFQIKNKKNVRLGIGEGLRAMFRSDIDKILVSDINNSELEFIISLARKQGVAIQEYDTEDYSCITLIRE